MAHPVHVKTSYDSINVICTEHVIINQYLSQTQKYEKLISFGRVESKCCLSCLFFITTVDRWVDRTTYGTKRYIHTFSTQLNELARDSEK